MLKAGHHLTLEIERLSLGGEGIAHAGPLVVFVPYSAPGDRLEVELTEVRPRYARGRPLALIRPSRDRTTPPCPYHFQLPSAGQGLSCGGCSWQHLLYETQLAAKQQLVQETLERIGGIRDIQVEPVLGMKDPWRYRNKVQQPIGWDGRRLITGFYAPSSHAIVPIDDCLVQPELSVAILRKARAILEQLHARAYDARHHNGWIRHLLVRTASERAFLVFVTRTADFPHEKEIIQTLTAEFPELAGIHQNVNPARTNVILGRHWRKIYGADFIEERLGRLRFRLSPGSFFQVNTLQTEVLYDVVQHLAGRGDRLLDIYCGVGGIALWLAGQFKEIGGIEEVESAIRDARANAELNRIDNVRFETASAEGFLRNIDRRAGGHSLTVVLDPPRSGCAPAVLKALALLRARTIIYVSCDPATLARDIALLTKSGYRVQEIQPVDLFPHTPHIESVVRLT